MLSKRGKGRAEKQIEWRQIELKWNRAFSNRQSFVWKVLESVIRIRVPTCTHEHVSVICKTNSNHRRTVKRSERIKGNYFSCFFLFCGRILEKKETKNEKNVLRGMEVAVVQAVAILHTHCWSDVQISSTNYYVSCSPLFLPFFFFGGRHTLAKFIVRNETEFYWRQKFCDCCQIPSIRLCIGMPCHHISTKYAHAVLLDNISDYNVRDALYPLKWNRLYMCSVHCVPRQTPSFFMLLLLFHTLPSESAENNEWWEKVSPKMGERDETRVKSQQWICELCDMKHDADAVYDITFRREMSRSWHRKSMRVSWTFECDTSTCASEPASSLSLSRSAK